MLKTQKLQVCTCACVEQAFTPDTLLGGWVGRGVLASPDPWSDQDCRRRVQRRVPMRQSSANARSSRGGMRCQAACIGRVKPSRFLAKSRDHGRSVRRTAKNAANRSLAPAVALTAQLNTCMQSGASESCMAASIRSWIGVKASKGDAFTQCPTVSGSGPGRQAWVACDPVEAPWTAPQELLQPAMMTNQWKAVQ